MLMTEEEQDLVYKFIYLPLVRKVLESDLERIKQAGLKFREPYIEFIDRKIIQVGKELGNIKWKMSARKIKVYGNGAEKDRIETMWKYLVVCRGYEEEIRLPTYVIETNVKDYVQEYIK